MHSERYLQVSKEFKNCLLVSPFTLFISLINAFTYWRPIMKEELAKEKKAAETVQK